MAKFEFSMPQEFIDQLNKMGNTEEWIPKVLKAAAPILTLSLKNRAKISQQSEPGDMIESIKPSKIIKNDYGHFLVVRPTGKDKEGKRNMDKFAYMEFGTSKQESRPMIVEAINDVKDEMIEAMAERFNAEVR